MTLLEELAEARKELWAALEALPPDRRIYETWGSREVWAHIAGWELQAAECLAAHREHRPPLLPAYLDVDSTNERSVAVRGTMPAVDCRHECDAARRAVVALITEIGDLKAVVRWPWGSETIEEFLRGAVAHERDHAADARRAAQTS